MIQIILLVVAKLLVIVESQCLPLYYEINNNFTPPCSQVQILAENSFTLEDIEKTIILPIRTTYLISNIIAKPFYNCQQKTIRVDDSGMIHIFDQSVDIVLAYSVEKSRSFRDYKANSTGRLSNLSINITKKIQIINGQAVYSLLNTTWRFNSQIQPGPYDPAASVSDKNEFDELVRVNLTETLQQFIAKKLNKSLADIVKLQKISNAYGLEYILLDNHFPTTFYFGIQKLITEQNVQIIGYNATIKEYQSQEHCSQIILKDYLQSCSLITLQLIKNYFYYELTNNPTWNQSRFTENNVRSQSYQFYIASLEDVIPKALLHFDYREKTELICSADTQNSAILIDFQHIYGSINWKCSLMVRNITSKLLGFSVRIDYNIIAQQVNEHLQFVISNLAVNGKIAWWSNLLYPIEDQELAQFLVQSCLKNFKNKATMGSGFKQPYRKNPKVYFNKDSLRICQSQ